MGQGASREKKSDEPKFSGVRVTPGLVAQLRGIPLPQGSPGGSATDLAIRTKTQIEAEAAAIARQNQQLAHALQTSHRVGDMLLQREEEELAKIEQLAEELIQQQYQAPSREKPCQECAAACLACYEQHPDDVTKCSAEVEAYAACARQATASVL